MALSALSQEHVTFASYVATYAPGVGTGPVTVSPLSGLGQSADLITSGTPGGPAGSIVYEVVVLQAGTVLVFSRSPLDFLDPTTPKRLAAAVLGLRLVAVLVLRPKQ